MTSSNDAWGSRLDSLNSFVMENFKTIMMSFHRHTFRITGLLWEWLESPFTQGQYCGVLMFSLLPNHIFQQDVKLSVILDACDICVTCEYSVNRMQNISIVMWKNGCKQCIVMYAKISTSSNRHDCKDTFVTLPLLLSLLFNCHGKINQTSFPPLVAMPFHFSSVFIW